MKTQNTLADLRPEATHLDVACSRCDRRGRLSAARLLEQHGPGATLRDAVAPGSMRTVRTGKRMA